MTFAAVVVAAGKSSRFGSVKKEYRLLEGRPVLFHAANLFLGFGQCRALVVVVPPGGQSAAMAVLGSDYVHAMGERLLFTAGGAERSDSVYNGLTALTDCDPELVMIHDAARPWATPALVERVLAGAIQHGACVPGIAVGDTIKQVAADGHIVAHHVRSTLRAAQTPQAFDYQQLLAAYRIVERRGAATDDAEIWAMAGGQVYMVEGERSNTKITFPEDLP